MLRRLFNLNYLDDIDQSAMLGATCLTYAEAIVDLNSRSDLEGTEHWAEVDLVVSAWSLVFDSIRCSTKAPVTDEHLQETEARLQELLILATRLPKPIAERLLHLHSVETERPLPPMMSKSFTFLQERFRAILSAGPDLLTTDEYFSEIVVGFLLNDEDKSFENVSETERHLAEFIELGLIRSMISAENQGKPKIRNHRQQASIWVATDLICAWNSKHMK